MQRVTANRFLQNLEGGRTSVGAVVTMSDLVAAFSCDFEKNFFAASVEKLREICA